MITLQSQTPPIYLFLAPLLDFRSQSCASYKLTQNNALNRLIRAYFISQPVNVFFCALL